MRGCCFASGLFGRPTLFSLILWETLSLVSQMIRTLVCRRSTAGRLLSRHSSLVRERKHLQHLKFTIATGDPSTVQRYRFGACKNATVTSATKADANRTCSSLDFFRLCFFSQMLKATMVLLYMLLYLLPIVLTSILK